MVDLNEIKSIDPEDILYHYGIAPSHVSKRYILASAPYRQDNNPSFQYFLASSGIWIWNDFATGESGSHIDLVMKMENMDFKEAVEYLAKNFLHGYTRDRELEKIKEKRNRTSEIKILSVEEMPLSYTHRKALEKERGYTEIDDKNIKTFKATMEKDGKEFTRFGYGIRDINGNAIVRVEKDGFYTKEKRVWKTSDKRTGITFIDNGRDTAIVVEGLHDYMAIYNHKQDRYNYLILNSVVNTQQAIEFLQDREYSLIIATDNDDAGIKAREELISNLNKNREIYYLSFESKDIDEALRSGEKVVIRKEKAKAKVKI